MRILLVLAFVCLAVSRGVTYSELQTVLLEQFNSPFVNLMFVYDGSTEGTHQSMQLDLPSSKEWRTSARTNRTTSKL